MRHSSVLGNNVDRASVASIDMHRSLAGSLAGARPDQPLAINAQVAAGPPRLSQSEASKLVSIKRIIRVRGKRNEHFDRQMFADPGWDILLALACAEIEQRRTTISDLCQQACVPATTALRWIHNLTIEGKLERTPDAYDRRRVYITLSQQASSSMNSFLQAIQ